MAFCEKHLPVVLLCVLINYVFAQELPSTAEYEAYGRAIKCKSDNAVYQRCMPVFENIAYDKDIYANSTCGLSGPSMYCMQVSTSGAKKVCDTCDNNVTSLAHPARLMTDMNVDNTPTWWQSETLHMQKRGTHLILDFKKKYNVAFVRIRFRTIRPHSFSIYKRSTYDPNEEWLPYQFYSRNCEETYGQQHKASVLLSNQKVALCSDEFSGMIPLSGGNIAYLTLYNRPGKKNFDDYPELQEWVTVSALRFNFDRLNTFGDEVFGDPKVLKSYYFAVSDIAVGGRCKCNGHASTCDRDDNGNNYCECDHNTAGQDCEKCLPLYNDQSWRKASGRSANPCTRCDCNGLADQCVFDKQLWLDSNSVSGGRCVGCQRNTDGVHCERCKEFHYRETEEDACKPCNCDHLGSHSLSCNTQGKCACKPGVMGYKCDQCKPGYFGLSASGCTRCTCDVDGSTSANCDATGQCKCKESVIGKQCDKCPSNFFDLDANNPRGCKACFCYGHGINCTVASESGFKAISKKIISSSFETDFDDWTLQDEFGNDYTRNMEWSVRDQYVFITPTPDKELYLVAPSRYLGNRLTSYTKVFSFLYGVFKQRSDPAPTPSRKDIIIEGGGLTAGYEITSQGNEKPAGRFIDFRFNLIEPPGMTTFDFQRLLSEVTSIKIRATYLPKRRGAIDNIQLESTGINVAFGNAPEQVTWKEECVCKQGYTGPQCKECHSGYTRTKGNNAPYGKCVTCECNGHGSNCDSETGVCECTGNTTGRNCETCKTGFYGTPSREEPDPCRPCPCIVAKAGAEKECLWIGSRLKCTNCPEGHIGDSCEFCMDGYFAGPDWRCKKCNCSGNIDLNDIGNCDILTGECLKCLNNSKNGPEKKCEVCAPGFFGDAVNGECTKCNCFENGTSVSPNRKPGEPISCDAVGKCPCRDNVIGERCDACPPDEWNVASGCEKCECNEQGSSDSSCDIASGKCQCKPGVDGRTCNKCRADHYKFSPTGCKSCNCHSEGSLDQKCSSIGVCECRAGVIGLKCNQCPENKFNLSVGCMSCPRCFNLIQDAVNDVREKIRVFNLTGGRGGWKIKLKDEKFEKAMSLLKLQIGGLRGRLEGLLSNGGDVYTFVHMILDETKALTDKYLDVEKRMSKSANSSRNGQMEVKKAGEVVDVVNNLLKELVKRMDEERERIHQINSRGKGGRIKIVSLVLAAEARKLADRQENEAKKMKMRADRAFNTTSSAVDISSNADKKQGEMTTSLKYLQISVSEAKNLAKESETLANDAKNIANISLKTSEQLYSNAQQTLPEFGHVSRGQEATNLRIDSSALYFKSTSLEDDSKLGAIKFQKNEMDARELLGNGHKLRKASNDMHKAVQSAYDETKKAQVVGLNFADDAREILSTLEGGETLISKSKVNASNAKEMIPEIKAWTQSARDNAREASGKADMSESDVVTSLNSITAANNAIMTSKTEADGILDEAKQVLGNLTKYVDKAINDANEDIKGIDENLNKYKELGIADAMEIAKADNDSSDASNSINAASEGLLKSLRDVEELLTAVYDLGDIDVGKLEAAEKDFQAADVKITGQIRTDISELKTRVVEQERKIVMYERNLSELLKQVDYTQGLYDGIPKSC